LAQNSIHIKGARVHNLRNIEVDIPHNQLVVITGLSGSGKSTLAFDTIFAEGQRRYVESLSAYARQFLGRIDKPDVDFITGIAPAIAIEQRVNTRNPRSTVGTSTEIYDYLKLLFARIGHTFSPVSGREVRSFGVDDVVEYIASMPEGERVIVTAPLLLERGQGLIERLTLLMGEGVQRVWYRGETQLIEELLPTLDGDVAIPEIDIVIDRFKVAGGNAHGDYGYAKKDGAGGGDIAAGGGATGGVWDEFLTRAGDSVARAFDYGSGVCKVVSGEDDAREIREFSSRMEMDGIVFEQPTEHLFSFNNPIGACPVCEGYGKVTGIDEDLVVPDKSKSVYDEAIVAWRGETMGWWRKQLIANAWRFDFPIHAPFYDLTEEQRRLLWTGNEHFKGLDRFFEYLESERYKIQYRVMLSRYTGKTVCPECGGGRLRREAFWVKVGGRSIGELVRMTVDELRGFFGGLVGASEGVLGAVSEGDLGAVSGLDEHDREAGGRVLTEIVNRLQYLADVGLGYLTLDRLSSTLSGGESQRINLSSSLGSNLVGSLYILDEPSIGLHPRDTERLIGVLKQLRDLGNTVIVVEHDEETMRAADQIIDIGPRAGYLGGEIVYSGDFEGLMTATDSLTADYLTGRRRIVPPDEPRGWRNFVELKGVRENNLKGVDVKFPLGVMTCVTGVSGSGKSTLVRGVLYPALKRRLDETGLKPGSFSSLEGDVRLLTGVEMIDQNPIGRSSRSNPVTYIKAYDEIRKLFADQPYAKHNAMPAAFFSFNTAGGRCEECQGEGVIHVEMQFMADVELVCEACGGRRFKDEVLEVRYRDRNIFEVLEMTVDEAIEFFGEDKSATARRIVERLGALQGVGLGYVRLGQSSSTLSGGESQRVKLASFLLKDSSDGRMMFIFDEPTTGLHFHDINKLLTSLNALIVKGHTVVIIEHNPDVIRCADHVIDLGPEGGADGGRVLFSGTPAALEACSESYTGRYLAGFERGGGTAEVSVSAGADGVVASAESQVAGRKTRAKMVKSAENENNANRSKGAKSGKGAKK
jgi:excinuclease ABC subunit A